jgi:urease accessory protein UreH
MPNFRATSQGNIPFTAEEEIEWAAQQAAWFAGADSRKAAEIRLERNAKLTASDWTQIADATVDKTAWATYRQALRNIPAQSGFPNTVVWPDAP